MNKKTLNFIYDRLVNVYGENENLDYMISFKENIDEINILEAKLLDAVHKLVFEKTEKFKDSLTNYLAQTNNEEVKKMLDHLLKQEDNIYNQYGISRQNSGSI